MTAMHIFNPDGKAEPSERNKPAKLPSNVEPSFAAETIKVRFPKVIESVIASLGEHRRPALARLLDDVQSSASVEPALLMGRTAWWDRRAEEARGTLWRQWPFLDLEFMFYRAIDRISDGSDPFRSSKEEAVISLGDTFLADLERSGAAGDPILALLAECTFANDHDLSQADAPGGGHRRTADRLIADDRAGWLRETRDRQGAIAIILDNVGRELTADLALAEAALRTGLASSVDLHAKAMPMFVSDVTVADLEYWMESASSSKNSYLAWLGRSVIKSVAAGQIRIHASEEWSEARSFGNLGGDLVDQLCSCSGVIAKGDLNYRRFIEDRAWPFDTAVAAATAGVPFRAAVLRSLKSEVLVGIEPVRVEGARVARKRWLVDGYFGIVQTLGGSSGGMVRTRTES